MDQTKTQFYTIPTSTKQKKPIIDLYIPFEEITAVQHERTRSMNHQEQQSIDIVKASTGLEELINALEKARNVINSLQQDFIDIDEDFEMVFNKHLSDINLNIQDNIDDILIMQEDLTELRHRVEYS